MNKRTIILHAIVVIIAAVALGFAIYAWLSTSGLTTPPASDVPFYYDAPPVDNGQRVCWQAIQPAFGVI